MTASTSTPRHALRRRRAALAVAGAVALFLLRAAVPTAAVAAPGSATPGGEESAEGATLSDDTLERVIGGSPVDGSVTGIAGFGPVSADGSQPTPFPTVKPKPAPTALPGNVVT